MRQGHVQAGLLQPLANGLLVRRVDKRKQQGDRHRGNAVVADSGDDRVPLGRLQGLVLAAVGQDPSADAESQRAWHQAGAGRAGQVVQFPALLSADFDQVFKSAVGDQRGGCTAVFEQGIGGDRGAVDQGSPHAVDLRQAGLDGCCRVVGC